MFNMHKALVMRSRAHCRAGHPVLILAAMAAVVASGLLSPTAPAGAPQTGSTAVSREAPPTDVSLASFGPHGTVVNKSRFDVKITKSWCASVSKPCSNADIKTLKPGKTSSGDIDGFEVPSGKRYSVEYNKFIGKDRRCVGSGWHKIDNTIVVKIYRTC